MRRENEKVASKVKKKRLVVFMGLTVSGLPEKAVGQLLGFLAAGSEVMSAAIQGSKELLCAVPVPAHSLQHRPASKQAC